MNLHHTPYNYDSKPTQPRERTDAEQRIFEQDQREDCQRWASHQMADTRLRQEWLATALEDSDEEVMQATDAIAAWDAEGLQRGEQPVAEVFQAMRELMNRAERLAYEYKCDKEGVSYE